MIRNPYKTKLIKDLGSVDVHSFVEKVRAIPDSVWDEQNQDKPNKFYELSDTKHIVFKFVHELNDCTKFYEFPIWNEWRGIIQPLLNEAVKPYGYTNGQFSRIMLAKLKAGGSVKAHKDGNEAATFPHKIHIPVVTNPNVTFFVNPKLYHFEVGQAYEVNNLAVHYAENAGDEDRIHLIFEYFNLDHLKTLNVHNRVLDNSIME